MHAAGLACVCGVKIDAPIATNEFAALSGEQLHFLRMFVRCEGRIRDLEAGLGISYPTVKARIRDLKTALHLDDAEEAEGADSPVDALLDQLERGEISAEDALGALKPD